ncbi:phage tail tape measure protein [Ahrensia kielensis]|uniref:Phage tail tape measure protein n=2 Tax=Ahrensia kielensis TaxID=76980 RepID=A0ABU9T9E0_9HYPH
MNEEFVVSIEADTQGFENALRELEKQAGSFGNTITSALKSAVVSGKSLEDTLRSIALSLAGSALSGGLAPLKRLLNNLGSQIFGGIGSVMPFAKGGVPGGIVASPTYFPNGSSIGVMGEAGAEAIMPLKRGSDGSLGVAAGADLSARSANIIVNISTPDIDGFKRSSGQVSAALARAVSRGQRTS